MELFDDKFCQICDTFITRDQWNKHLSSGRHLQRELNSCWPTCFRLTGDEAIIVEKAFLDMIFWSEDILILYEFLKTNNMLLTNMKDYVKDDDDGGDDYKDDFGYFHRDNMISHDLSNIYIYITKISVFKIKVNVMKMILSRREINFGLMLVIWGVQYLIMFMIMNISVQKWIFTSDGLVVIWSSESWKTSW